MPLDFGQTTRLLQRASAGEKGAEEELLLQLYEELKAEARRCMARQADGHTLQPTALVHEAYLRIFGSEQAPSWNDRAHFVRAAAQAMRQALVDHARARNARKRGDGSRAAPLDAVLASFEEQSVDVIDLHEAVERLGAMDERLARVVDLRFFAGLTLEEIAGVLGVSRPTVDRAWRVARMWLKDELDP